ncbi:hypothetical protein H8959_008261 [Pygathrix nigripes]
MAVWLLWAGRRQVQCLLASSAAWESKGWPLPFSTATQITAGVDCCSEDPPEAKLKNVFVKHDLEKLSPISDKYDPQEHEFICHVTAAVGVQPGTVTLVRQDGYKLYGCTIRLAHVEVAVESQRRL